MTDQKNEDRPDIVRFLPLIFTGCAVFGTIGHFFFADRVLRYPISLLIGVLFASASTAWLTLLLALVLMVSVSSRDSFSPTGL